MQHSRSENPAFAPALPDVVFVRGCPRSGTTLLADLLNESSQIGLLVEQPLGDLARRLDGMCWYEDEKVMEQRVVSEGRAQRMRAEGAQLYDLHENLDRMRFQTRYPTRGRRGHMLAALVEAALDKPQLRIIGSKTPGRWEHTDVALLREMFGSLKSIFIVRNPFDTVNSIINFRNNARAGLHVWPDKPVEDAIRSYQESIGLLLSSVIDDPDSTFVVKYEDLVSHPDWTLKVLGDFMGVRLHDWSRLIKRPTGSRAPLDVLTEDERRETERAFGSAIANWGAKKITGHAHTGLLDELRDCLTEAPAQRRFLFRAPVGDRSLLGAGWSGSGPSGIHADGPHSDLFFTVPRAGRYAIEIRASATNCGAFDAVERTMWVNGVQQRVVFRRWPSRVRVGPVVLDRDALVQVRLTAPDRAAGVCIHEARICSVSGAGIPQQ